MAERTMIFRTIIATQLIVVLFVFACDFQKRSESGDQNQSQRIVTPASNPLEHALTLLDLNPSNMIRPLFPEAGYHLIARNPLIDRVAASPFYLHNWADNTSSHLQKNARAGLADILSFMILTLNGGASWNNQFVSVEHRGSFADAYRYLCKQHGSSAEEMILNLIQGIGFSQEFDSQLGQIVFALADSSLLAKQAFASLNPEELEYLASHPERFFFPSAVQFDFLTAATHIQQKVVSVTRKIDFKRLFVATLLISSVIDRFNTYINGLDNPHNAANFFSDDRDRQNLVLDIPSPAGNIVILGQDDNVYAGSGMLIVDLGGNDHYSGPIAVGHLMPGRLSIAIDINGNDVYDCKKNRFSLGFGSTAVGMLVDLAGNDHYLAGDMAQGSGIFGMGIMADLEGQDVYTMGLMGQGFGVFGIGLLLDKAGDDRYMINGLGQGVGSTMGFGTLLDIEGSDKYLAEKNAKKGSLSGDDWNYVQGAGLSIRSPDWTKQLSLYGGIGFLSDGAGDDFYFSSDGNCMGSSYFMSIGALVDHDGNDKYIPKNGCGLGFAVHLSNAVLIDRQGDDYYFAKNRTGGVGSDRSVALMVDYEGNDVYGPTDDYARKEIEAELRKAKIRVTKQKLDQHIQEKLADVSFGSALKPKALGFLIDYQGNDYYFARQSGWGESCGGVIPPADPRYWSHALLLDLGGNDFYFKEGRKDNHYFRYFKHGLCYDTEYQGKEIIGKTPLPPDLRSTYQIEKQLVPLKNSPIYAELKDLLDPDLFTRYSATGRIVLKGPQVLSDLNSVLMVSESNELNRDIIEILNTFVIQHQIKQRHSKYFEALLNAKDPFVRGFAALTFGWHRVRSAVPALVQALEEKNEELRSHVIWALGQIDAADVIEPISRIALSDLSLECRKSAYIALENHIRNFSHHYSAKKKIIKLLFAGLKDSDEIIRLYAASALYPFGDDPEVISELENSLMDPSVYVKRAAARSIVLNGLKDGIPVLIETLKYPSIDTFEHYDHELTRELAYYCGIDFPSDQRYNYNTWSLWWQQNGATVNLKQNLAVMNDIDRAFEAQIEEKGIEIFERLLAEKPGSLIVKNRYIRFCYEWITFRLLTKDKISEDILERCLRLQKIKARLEPENPQTYASLAYFYASLNNYKDAASSIKTALRLDPDNQDYQNILKTYAYLYKIRTDKEGS